MAHDELPYVFGFVLVPQFSMMPVAAAIEPLRLANRAAERELYRWRTASVNGVAVTASNGLDIQPDGRLDDLPENATVLVCSGVEVQKNTDKALLNWLRKRARRGARMGALCTASHILAQAGVLDGYRCTIHWENMSVFSETFEEITPSGHLYEIDRDRFTCAGGTASLDMMLAIIAADHGEELAANVADQILHAPIRHHTEHQRRSIPARIGTRHPKLRQIIEQMEMNIEEPVSPAELARRVGLSARQIERLFKRYLQRTPKRYYLELRLQKARLLLLQTNSSVINVALSCGFSSPSHFSKCYRAFFGRTPYRERGMVGEGRQGEQQQA